MTNWVYIAAMVAALTIAGGLIGLYKEGKLRAEGVEAIGTLVDAIEGVLMRLDPDGGTVTIFADYAAKAVRVVEQLVKNGELEKDNALRKNEAMTIVEQLAVYDGVEPSTVKENEAVIDILIEAAVNEMQSGK